MPKRLGCDLSAEQRQELIFHRDHASKPCERERCALVLKVADGVPQYQVAETGLLKRRSDDMVRKWYRRYLQEGLAGLSNRRGQGRKPAFSPGAFRRSQRQRGTASSGAP